MIQHAFLVALILAMASTASAQSLPDAFTPTATREAQSQTTYRLRVILILKGDPDSAAFSIAPGATSNVPRQVSVPVSTGPGTTMYVTETRMVTALRFEVSTAVDPGRIASLYCDNIQISSAEEGKTNAQFNFSTTGPATLVVGNLTLQGDNITCQNGVLKCENARTTATPGELKINAESITLEFPIQQAISEAWNKGITPASVPMDAPRPLPGENFENEESDQPLFYPASPAKKRLSN